jgi:aminopeptidase YwaD
MRAITGFPHVSAFAILFVMILANANCQDITYAKSITDALCSSRMQGRGYVRNGDFDAAKLIKHEYRRIGLRPYTPDYFQPFQVRVNTFPGAMKLAINGVILLPGRDYMIDPASGKCRGKFDTYTIPVQTLVQHKADSIIALAGGKVLIIDARELHRLNDNDKARVNVFRKKLLAENIAHVKAVIELTEDKLSYGISSVAYSIPYFKVNAAACPDAISIVSINIRNQFLDRYETRNVAGFISGTGCPDSMLVFTAHYDHLGTMGRKTYFPGANDNASGVSMLLALADYYKANPARYSMVFLTFSGEELGLLGSGYFTDNPLVDLSKIRFLINLDLVGNGAEGITVVNGSVYPEMFNTLTAINDAEKLLPVIKKRGDACNSDHCPFYRKGVPCFFIYTLGGSSAIHVLDDRPELLTYDGFEGLTRLLIEFLKSF